MKSKDSVSAPLAPVLLNDALGDSQLPHILADKPVNEYVELKQVIKKHGLLKKQPVYYVYKVTLTLGMLVASIIFLFLVHNFWIQLLNAAFLAMVSAQIGFLGHDAGHRQIFHSTRKNNMLALLLGNVLIGMSNTWWLDKHNRHHSHPNEVDLDPDIEIAVIALTEEIARRKRSYQRFIVKYQAFFFFPLLSLVSLGLCQNSIVFLFQHKSKHRIAEGLLLVAHYVLYISMLLYCFNIWQALLFALVHQLLFGLFLGSAFAPNHKGMPILEKGASISFFRRQVLTSRNVNSGLFNDFWYGGLNYQIEHHLFPSMPRNRLKAAQRIVKAYCQTRSIAYAETSIFQSYCQILGFLHQVSAPLRVARVEKGL
jgi:fatty acid desaturase